MKKILIITPPKDLDLFKTKDGFSTIANYFQNSVLGNFPIVLPSPEWKYEVVELSEIAYLSIPAERDEKLNTLKDWIKENSLEKYEKK